MPVTYFLLLGVVIGIVLGWIARLIVVTTRTEGLLSDNERLRRENIRYKQDYNKYLADIYRAIREQRVSGEQADKYIKDFQIRVNDAENQSN